MIDPVTGGYATEDEIQHHLTKLRGYLMSYLTLDRETGGLWHLGENIRQLELTLALKGIVPMTRPSDAHYEFMRRHSGVKWNSGVPTWEYYELVDGQWRITVYEVSVDLTNPRVRTMPRENY